MCQPRHTPTHLHWLTRFHRDYFIGFAAVYLFSLFVRWGKSFKHGFHHRASFEVLADRMLKITIPSHVAHAPGQHFFFRFLDTGVHSWTSHPFTVASVSASGQMEIFARVGRGITERLASIAGDKDASVPVLLDGPYGGVGGEVGIYDRVLLIGGGSGEPSHAKFRQRSLTSLIPKADPLFLRLHAT